MFIMDADFAKDGQKGMGFVWQSQRNDHSHLRPLSIISLHDTMKKQE